MVLLLINTLPVGLDFRAKLLWSLLLCCTKVNRFQWWSSPYGRAAFCIVVAEQSSHCWGGSFLSAFCSRLNRGQICWKLLNCTGSTAQAMEHSFTLFSQLSAPSAIIGFASFQPLTSHYRPSCEHAALWLETNVWALITIWRENETPGQLNLAASRIWSGAWEAVHQATALLSWKASFHHGSLAGGSSWAPAGATGAAGCTDQLLKVGQSFLLLWAPGCSGANWCGEAAAPCRGARHPKAATSPCLHGRTDGLHSVSAGHTFPAKFGTVAPSKTHISAEYWFQGTYWCMAACLCECLWVEWLIYPLLSDGDEGWYHMPVNFWSYSGCFHSLERKIKLYPVSYY